MSAAVPSPRPRPFFGQMSLSVQVACVFLATLAAYIALYSHLRTDDTIRFISEVMEGEFEWDASHLLMQPATALWHQLLNLVGVHALFSQKMISGVPDSMNDALFSQRTINSVSAAASYAIFYLLLRRLGIDPFRRVVLVLIAASSVYMLMLGTSGHMKLTTAPWLAAALYCCVLWEGAMNDPSRSRRAYRHYLIGGAGFLALATCFLINAVVVLPFLAIAMLAVLLRRKEPLAGIGAVALVFTAIYAAVVVPVFWGGYLLSPEASAGKGFLQFLLEKQGTAARPVTSLALAVAQTAYSMIRNFVALDDLGPVARAWLNGDLAFDASYLPAIAKDALYAALTGLVLAATYLHTAIRAPKFESPALTPAAFLLGGVAFGLWWNHHEAEFFFQITLPTLVMAAFVRPVKPARWVLAGWAALLVTANVVEKAVPRAAYPMSRYERALGATFGANDLFIIFSEWSGRPQLSQFRLPNIPKWYLDKEFGLSGSVVELFRRTRVLIDASHRRGGRVIVFRMLDERDWDAPWSKLPRMGLSKRRLRDFFEDGYRVVPLGELAEIKVWEIKPKN